MKKLLSALLVFVLLFTSVYSTIAYATGDGNIDGGGGGMGDGNSMNTWTPSNEGVRVTVVRASDHAVVTAPIDLTNKAPATSIYNFGKVSKMQYNNGTLLTPIKGGYTAIKTKQSIPKIISTNGRNNIEAIKSYFTDEQVIRAIADYVGMDFDILTDGRYKLLLEPLAYYKFEGEMFATTATEAAMYDEKVNGLLRSKMVSLSHKNLPLAMFLEVSDLGYPAWGGSTTTPASNANIKSTLGLGIVRFTEKPEVPDKPEEDNYDYEYRVNTEVITSVRVSGGESTPDERTSVTFQIDGKNYNVSNIYYPEWDSQLVWVRWTTPSEPKTMTINVSVSGGKTVSKSRIKVNIVDLDRNPPPNPIADDRNDNYEIPALPNNLQKTSTSWSIWQPYWHYNWVWVSNWVYFPKSVWVPKLVWQENLQWQANYVWESNRVWEPKHFLQTTYVTEFYQVWEPKMVLIGYKYYDMGRFVMKTRVVAKSQWIGGYVEMGKYVDKGKYVDYGYYVDKGSYVDQGEWKDLGSWEDFGWWKFNSSSYSASLSASMSITPDDKNPTAVGKTMKSGYGINQTVTATVRTSQSSAVTGAQTAVTYFPEFRYENYWRLLEPIGSGYNQSFEFKKNMYSTYKRRTHFTPIWQPDGSYTPYTYVKDIWTPTGMLSINLKDTVNIQGNLWLDWHIGEQKPD